MCLQCLLHCPACDAHIDGVETRYLCLLKLQNMNDNFSCITKTAKRCMTPMEMALTARTCPNLCCTMNVGQQLIAQSKIWHALDIMDDQQMAEHQAQAPNIPRSQRARLYWLSRGGPEARFMPMVAGDSQSSNSQWPRIPSVDTPENLLLHRFMAERRQRLFAIRHSSEQIEGFWGHQINAALDFVGRTIYYPATTEDTPMELTPMGMQRIRTPMEQAIISTRAALSEEEYAMLCCFTDLPPYQFWAPYRPADQSGLPQSSGPENTPAPASGRKRKASSQSPVASTSTPAGSQLETVRASLRRLQSGPPPVDSSSALGSSVASPRPNTSNAASNNTNGSAYQPGNHAGVDNSRASASVPLPRPVPRPQAVLRSQPVAGVGGPATQPRSPAESQGSQKSSSTNDRPANMDGPPPQPAILAKVDHISAAPEVSDAPPSKSPDITENSLSNN